MVTEYTFAKEDELKSFLQNFSAENFILSSVSKDATSILNWVQHIKRRFILTSTLPIPINSLYATPETLGVDRIAGVCGAAEKFAASNCLVIDAGSCITYDFLDNKRNHHGVSISPCLKMRLQAMHTFTAKLPLADIVENPPLIGNTTTTCLQSGAINGMVQEINGIITLYQQQFEGIQVILCGGDARFFENKLKAPIFAIPNLVLSGLNSILIYNVGS